MRSLPREKQRRAAGALTNKQQAFVNEYLVCWNATKAAIAAGYSERSAYQIGYENLQKPAIAAEITRRIEEAAMNANEVLYRLAEQARASLGDFVSLRGGLPFFDLEKAEAAGKMHLIKRLRVTDKSLDIELHDAQAALIHLLRELTLKAGTATDKLKIEVEYAPLPDDQLDGIFS